MTPPDAAAAAAAAERLSGLAVPAGALGRLGDLGVWLAGCQGQASPRPPRAARLAIFAGDHGVAAHGTSAYPAEITGAMVATFAAGGAGVNALARAHGVEVRVVDVSVGRPSGAIHLEDAVSRAAAEDAMVLGDAVAAEEVAAGADLLISGDMGIGNTTPAAALVAALLGLHSADVVGRGTGVDDAGLARKTAVVDAALARVGGRAADPVEALAALGGADLAATTGFLLGAARRGVPVLLDGVVALACALVAQRLEPGFVAWCAAGHRSPEPSQQRALTHLGLEPLLDLGMRLGEGSGAVAAVPLVRAAAALLGEVALLADLLPAPAPEPAGA